MNRVLDWLTLHWFSGLLLALALALGAALLLLRQRRGSWSVPLLVWAAAFALLGLGGLIVAPGWAVWVMVAAAAALFLMLLVLILSGYWYSPAAAAAGAIVVLAFGGLVGRAAGDALAEGWKVVRGVEFLYPWWLALLALIPVMIF